MISAKVVLFDRYNLTGTIGVSLFFILSGAALMWSTHDGFRIREFYRRRCYAIFPVFYTTYIFFILAYVILVQKTPFRGIHPLTFLLTLMGMDGFFLYKIPNYYLIGEWFLGCIIIYYIFFPIIRYLFKRNASLFIAGSFVVWILFYMFYSLDMMIDRFPLARIIEFLFGMNFIKTYGEKTDTSNAILLTASLFGFIILFRFDLQGIPVLSSTALGIMSFAFLAAFSSAFKNLSSPFINFLSKYAYPAFLLHHLILRGLISSFKVYMVSRLMSSIVFCFVLVITFSFSVFIFNLAEYLFRSVRAVKTLGQAAA